jgi:2'-5' RNA ligase
MISLSRIIKAFWQKEAFDYSSIQCNMPLDLAEEIISWGKENIPDEDLTGDGREKDIHITIKYGLHDHDPFEVRELLSNFGPIDITLGKTSIFTGDEFDVVKIDVISPGLCELNALISKNFKHTDTHPKYIPHLTVAYVKSGTGKKYVGSDQFKGRKIKVDSVIFSGNDNRKTGLVLDHYFVPKTK